MELIIDKEEHYLHKLEKSIFESGYYVDERKEGNKTFHLYSTDLRYFELEYHFKSFVRVHEIELDDIANLYSKNIYAALMFFHKEEPS